MPPIPGKRARLAAIVASAGLGLALSLWLASSSQPFPPVTIGYILDRNHDGGVSDQPRFWVSNRTDKPLMIRITSVESRASSTWTNFHQCSYPLPLVFYRETGKSADIVLPHQTEESTLGGSRLLLPPAGEWRIKALVLTRQSRITTHLVHMATILRSRRLLSWLVRTNTVVVTSPAGPPAFEFFRPVCEVTSQVTDSGGAQSHDPGTPIAPRADQEVITRAREALHRKMREADDNPSAQVPP